MTDKFKSIKNNLRSLASSGFEYTELSKNIHKVEDTKGPKYVIFEPVEIYRNIDDMIEFLNELQLPELRQVPLNNILRIPFFAGCTGFDLGNLIIPDSQFSTDIALNFEINFTTLPVDFNFAGATRFAKYLQIIKNRPPVYKSANNYSNYQEYFNKILEDKEFRVNTFLPIEYKILFESNEAVQTLFDGFEEIIKE